MVFVKSFYALGGGGDRDDCKQRNPEALPHSKHWGRGILIPRHALLSILRLYFHSFLLLNKNPRLGYMVSQNLSPHICNSSLDSQTSYANS